VGTVAFVAFAVVVGAAIEWARHFFRRARWPLVALGLIALIVWTAATDEEPGTGALVVILVLVTGIQAIFWWWSPARRERTDRA